MRKTLIGVSALRENEGETVLIASKLESSGGTPSIGSIPLPVLEVLPKPTLTLFCKKTLSILARKVFPERKSPNVYFGTKHLLVPLLLYNL